MLALPVWGDGDLGLGCNPFLRPLPEAQKSGQNIPINAAIVRIDARISSHEINTLRRGKIDVWICATSKNQAETVGMVIENQDAPYSFVCAIR
jgi:hypothetical protein